MHNIFRWLQCQLVWFWILLNVHPTKYISKICAKLKECEVKGDGRRRDQI